MRERCPHCGKFNLRVHSSYVLHGWESADDYCGWCGKNWPRPKSTRDEPPSNVEQFPRKEP